MYVQQHSTSAGIRDTHGGVVVVCVCVYPYITEGGGRIHTVGGWVCTATRYGGYTHGGEE